MEEFLKILGSNAPVVAVLGFFCWQFWNANQAQDKKHDEAIAAERTAHQTQVANERAAAAKEREVLIARLDAITDSYVKTMKGLVELGRGDSRDDGGK